MRRLPIVRYSTADAGHRRWIDAAFIAWTALLVALPVALRHGTDPDVHNRYYVQVPSHAIVEIFCGVVALLIAGLILTIAHRRADKGIALFGFAFIAMGVLDILHAATSPIEALHRFVGFHTASVFAGGALTALAVLGYFWTHPRERPSARSAFAVTVIAAAALPLFLQDGGAPLGSVHESYGFSAFANLAHVGASFLYALAALAIYLHYRVTRQALSLSIAVMLLLFAESAYLFVFSQMWDFTWWLWHGVKSVFYVATLVTVFAGFVAMVRAVQRSHAHLTVANAELADARADLLAVNVELRARNAMARRAIHSLHLDSTLKVIAESLCDVVGSARCEFILRLPDDEVEEFARVARHQGFADSVYAIAASAQPLCTLDVGTRTRTPSDVYLPLYARDEEFGYLRVMLANGDFDERHRRFVRTLAAEAGPIINNALLYHRSAEEIAFRSALLRVSAQLASTLNLAEVLESVCSESALLLHSDGAAIWVGDADANRSVYSRCVVDDGRQGFVVDDKLYNELLARVSATRRPQALLKSAEDHARERSAAGACAWGSLALFPLSAQNRLLGIMAVVRRERVQFSGAALQKGEVLAEQVRLALNNARQYTELQSTNSQLRMLEESRLKAERLAALGQMAATVAHEVRNPLSALANCLAVLRTGGVGDRDVADGRRQGDRGRHNRAEALAIMSEEIDRLERLTRNFLTFGRSTGARNIRAIVLAEFAHNACAQLDRHIEQEERKISVRCEVRGSEPVVYFDSDGLWEVVWNLLLNAAQAVRDDGEVRLRLGASAGRLCISVSDNGRGIPSADYRRIFEPFYSSKPQGAGLGLAIVQQFVQQWRARLRLRTRAERGTQFCIRIPLTRASLHDATAGLMRAGLS